MLCVWRRTWSFHCFVMSQRGGRKPQDKNGGLRSVLRYVSIGETSESYMSPRGEGKSGRQKEQALMDS